MGHTPLKISVEVDKDLLEYYRILRTKVELIGPDKKVISIVSSLDGEGKTTIALNLSRSLSDIGRKVVFLDGDLRTSKLLDSYEIKNINDINSYLAEGKDIEGIIYKSEKENLDFIISSNLSPQSTELLSSIKFKELLSKLREKYDYIIIDTPSMDKSIDATIIAKESDGTVFVMEENKVLKKTVNKNLHQLKDTNCNVIGVVLNKSV